MSFLFVAMKKNKLDDDMLPLLGTSGGVFGRVSVSLPAPQQRRWLFGIDYANDSQWHNRRSQSVNSEGRRRPRQCRPCRLMQY